MAEAKPTREFLATPTFYDLTMSEDDLLRRLDLLYLDNQASNPAFAAVQEDMRAFAEAELLAALNSVREQRDAKLDRICAAIRRLDADCESLEQEAQRLQARAQRRERAADWLRTKVAMWMESHGYETIETQSGANRIKLAETGTAPVEILDEERVKDLPAEFITVVPAKYHPNKRALYPALKAGLHGAAFAGIVRLGTRTKRLFFS